MDLRVIKTKKSIEESLLELMSTKSFESIKVSEICGKALINRSTFYTYYQDKYDLLMNIINEIKNNLNINNKIKDKNYYLEVISKILDHIENKKNLYSKILEHNQNSFIIDILYNVLDNNINNTIETKFYLGGTISICLYWINGQNNYTKKDIINYLNNLIN